MEFVKQKFVIKNAVLVIVADVYVESDLIIYLFII